MQLESKEEIAGRCDALARCAKGLIEQLPTRGDRTYLYFYGVLVRYRTVLGDIGSSLRANDITHATSSFILFRVLLDDLMRLISVWASSNPSEILDQIDADAVNHHFKAKTLRIEYEKEYNPHSEIGMQGANLLETQKREFYGNPNHKNLFRDAECTKFKKIGLISDLFSRRETKPGWDIRVLSELYVIYKELSGHVHYSTITFGEDRDIEGREVEITLFGSIQFFLYKELLIHHLFFLQSNSKIVLNCQELESWFKSVSEPVK